MSNDMIPNIPYIQRNEDASKMSKKNAETTVVETKSVNMVKFALSESIPGTMKAVIFTPENWNEHYVNIGLFDASSCFNAIQEYLGLCVESAGADLHVRTQNYSLYDGTKSFYVGGSKVLKLIESGEKSMVMDLAGRRISVSLPKTTALIGSWAQVNMKLGDQARVIPAKDPNHLINTCKKHDALELLFRGTKLVMFTEPSLVKGEVFDRASKAAFTLQERILNEDGSFKTASEIATAYFEAKREYVSTNRQIDAAKRIMKVAPVLNLTVATIIVVDDQEVKPDDVPSGRYLITSADGKTEPFTHVRNLDSVNALRKVASEGGTLTTQRRF